VLTDAAVRKLRGVLAPRAGNTGAGGAATPVSPDDFPPPFTVRWAQSESEGQGAWVIWLPYMPLSEGDTPSYGPLLMVGNEYIDFLTGTAALQHAQTLPSGWFVLRNDAEGGAVYMNIVVPTFWSATGYVTAAIQTSPDTTPSSEEYLHFSVLIATMTTDEDTGAKRVKQAVDSIIQVEGPVFGPNGEGIWPSGGGESTPQPFDIDDDVVVRCYAPAPCGTMLVGANYAIDGTKGDILVHVDRNSQGVYTLSVNQTHRAESPTHHEWTLYQYQGGDVTCDCRPRVLPLIRFDDKSLDIDATNHNLQIKGFDNPANAASSTSLADDLHAQTAVEGHVLFRDNSGSLSYKNVGHLPIPAAANDGQLTITYGDTPTTFTANQPNNSPVSITISKGDNKTSVSVVTGVSWDSTNHELVISSAHFDIENGVIKNWTPDQPQPIPTTAISSILPQQGGGS
jgi:hypothetical protein